MAVTIADLHARVETDLDDEVLQRILDAAVKAIVRAAGSATVEVENFRAANSDWISALRPVVSVTSIKERRRASSDEVTLAADDYRQVGPYQFRRLAGGTNGARFWGDEVELTYVPEVDVEVRDRVTLDLCQVDLEFSAYAEEKSGDWSGKADWKKERAALLRQVREGRSPIV